MDLRNSAQRSKAGFTLMELMVYMAIVGVVVIIAGEAFSNSTRFRIRTDNMVKATQDAENVATLFKEDVEQLGSKSAKGAGNTFTSSGKRIYMDPENATADKKDSSSFQIKEDDDGFSILTFKKTRYDENNGSYLAIDSVRWYVEDNTLKRSCFVLEPITGYTIPDDDPCVAGDAEPNPIEMVSNISEFNVEAARPGAMENATQIFPASSASGIIMFPRLDAGGEYDRNFGNFFSDNEAGETFGAGNTITLYGFSTNYVNQEDNLDNAILADGEQKVNQAIVINASEYLEGDSWKTLCLNNGAMSFGPDTVYEISFEVASQSSKDRSVNFVPGKDHMSVGFRQPSTGTYAKSNGRIILPDFLFYPPLDYNSGAGAGKRSMRFTVPEHVEKVCLAFTFAFFSPLASSGKVTIKDLKVSQVATANYKFNGFAPESGSNIKEKKNVRALKVKLQVSRGARNGGKGETGDVNLVIPIPSNGTGD
jgi:prepilin-type N-terminal cleavage/methylation domain-containing protein